MLTDLFLKGRLRHEISQEYAQILEDAVSGTTRLSPRQTLVDRGERLDDSYYLIEGAMIRHIDDAKGERQLVGVSVPGDFVDLHAYPLKRLDHSVVALDGCELAKVPHSNLTRILADHPRLARILWFSTLLDAAMHREWIFRMGRLNSEGRIAHLLCELIERLSFVGRYDGRNFEIPLLQRDYAEACGITAVHANRSFRTLRERGVLKPRGEGRLEILDHALLCKIGEFSGDYLYGEGELALHSLSDQ